ncbi:MAG: class I SAM-dependent methyltransferase [Gammaproteobacteria bacterium]
MESSRARDETAVANRTGWLNRKARALLFRLLQKLDAGNIRIEDADGVWDFGTAAAPSELQSLIRVRNSHFYRRVIVGGSLGLAAAYLDGDWECEHLAGLFRAALRGLGRDNLPRPGRIVAATARRSHTLRANTRRGARRNIRDHYDLGNDFFALFLDDSMTYSAGIFEQPDASLEEAQRAKLDRICRKLAFGQSDRVLEIGTGWGSFALHAAEHYDCHVTTTTISEAQYTLAARRIAEAGLSHRITLLQKDYRDLEGSYDKLVSIEMIEAVGADHLNEFFRHCAARLDNNGQMLIQAIGVADQYYPSYRRSVDFIQKYVFPGSHCPSLGALITASARSSDLRLLDTEDITLHYVTTLRHWRKRFRARRDEIRALGYSERLVRLWEYYLQYCEAGFAENHVADRQLIFARPGFHGATSTR